MCFIHTADIHLGYQQYGSRDRFYDFCQVFLTIVERAIEQQVDFILLAGDLFEKRTVDPESMRVAIEGLRLLREAGIPVVAVEGNHERAYHREYSWLDFLDSLDYLFLHSMASFIMTTGCKISWLLPQWEDTDSDHRKR